MFDALGWTYAYEPIELAGYIPDFLITSGPGATEPMLVECKPFVDAAKGDAQDAAALAQRISRAWHGQALIVGAVHHVESDETGSRIRVGRIRGPLYLGKSKVSATKGAHWRDAYLARTDNTWSLDTDRCEHTSLCSLDVMTARMAWCDAGNVTQWKAPA